MTDQTHEYDEHVDGVFIRAMEDAALLPPGHPQREEVLRTVETANEKVQ